MRCVPARLASSFVPTTLSLDTQAPEITGLRVTTPRAPS
ncbi:hypothetical protein FOPG_19948 [Fusarium oxysporum f. sp. conglutinans race 2 54008]|uniref:Uncharacterized protein n=1 Tax=Fusarium oxysporum f. sp. conglutinans race 2 54008 TaxID=1089457 RepID=X0HRF3_FUSOX|nr:hypothetical protein FOPG_19948 [Fusarium oxysporum f. sp. conglutinans race 2 54008]